MSILLGIDLLTNYEFFNIINFNFCVQSHSIADDIQDLEIEGMSIGDSLLNYVEADIKGN